ncbi:glycosyltransferase family 2 protein [Pontibacter sp. MBLB2868]|uniref:glycosyltransferase family 2 protein n=1 Tax=Pontibacter sp. MBLB2868 TaxID=3451555 RepID=UPI003F74B058
MPSLSVLMPVFNSSAFLSEAIESILQQTFDDFEFLIIDDASTDNSAKIIQSYNDPRIRFYQNDKNLGISETLNRGIALATTPYIARMDADDISYPERLQKQVSYLTAHPECAMVSCRTRVITANKEVVRIDRFRAEHYYYNLTFICWIYHPTVILRKSAVNEVGNYTKPYSEDFELFWQISRRYKIHNLDEVLLDYRITGQSLHQVLKKEEYEQEQQRQVLRNIRFFTGDNYHLPLSYLECFRHNFQMLLAEGKVKNIIACIRELDFITRCILAKDNVNHNTTAIKKAAKYKRTYIISFFKQHLNGIQKAYLTIALMNLQDAAGVLKTPLSPLLKYFKNNN